MGLVDLTQQSHIYGYRHPQALSPLLFQGSPCTICLFPPPSLGLYFLVIIQAAFFCPEADSNSFLQSLGEANTPGWEQGTGDTHSDQYPYSHHILFFLFYSLVLKCAPNRTTTRSWWKTFSKPHPALPSAFNPCAGRAHPGANGAGGKPWHCLLGIKGLFPGEVWARMFKPAFLMDCGSCCVFISCLYLSQEHLKSVFF